MSSNNQVLLRHVSKAAAEGGLDLSSKEWRPRPSGFFKAAGEPTEGNKEADKPTWMDFKLPDGTAWFALPPAEEPK